MSKTITIRNEIYEELKRIKKKDESFSEFFERLSSELRPVDSLSKLRASVEFKDKKKLLQEIDRRRSERRP